LFARLIDPYFTARATMARLSSDPPKRFQSLLAALIDVFAFGAGRHLQSRKDLAGRPAWGKGREKILVRNCLSHLKALSKYLHISVR